MVGSAIARRLLADGASHLLLRSRSELDLTDQAAVEAFFAAEKPEYVFLAAAKVGGIHANNAYPAEFLRDNLAIQTNVIHSAWKRGAAKLCFLGSSCIYLSEARAAAAARGIPAHRPTGAHQRVVSGSQDRRHQNMPGLSPPVSF